MIHDAGDWLSASEARAQVASRIAEGELTTWLVSSDGRMLGLVSNRVRAGSLAFPLANRPIGERRSMPDD